MSMTKDPIEVGKAVQRLLEKGQTTFSIDDIEREIIEEQKRKEASIIFNRRKEEIKIKLERILSTNKIKTKDIKDIEKKLKQIIEDSKTEPYEKNKKLEEIDQELNEYEKEIEEIDKKVEEIKTNIGYAKMNRNIIYIRSIYNAENNLDALEEELNIAIYNPTLKEINQKLNEISKKLKEISLAIEQIYNLYMHQEFKDSKKGKRYKLNEIVITIDFENKKYTIEYEEKFIERLKKTKINRLKKLLKEKINLENIHEIIEPKYVNELTLSNFINKKIIPIQDLMKFNYIQLLKYLSLDELVNEISIEKLSSEDSEFKAIYDIMQILNGEGFKQENQDIFIEELKQEYKAIYLEANEINEAIAQTIIECCPNEVYVYSNMQNAYNCIDRDLIHRMHEELSNGNHNDSTRKVIEFIQKFSRKPSGEIYTEKEILNFLKQKNEIVNTKYLQKDSFPTQDLEQEFLVLEAIRNYLDSTRRHR